MIPVNQACIDLIKHWESDGGAALEAYHGKLDPSDVDTIGYGTIQYPPYYMNGKKVRVGDPKITEEQAVDFLMYEVRQKAAKIAPYIKPKLTDNQYAALISFAYNEGTNALKNSTLLRRVNHNPQDPTIRDAFLMWVFAGDGSHNKIDDDGDGKIDEPGEKCRVRGLFKRRVDEFKLYFTP